MTLEALFDDTRARLAGAPREALGELVRPTRFLGVARAPRITPVGEAWHLGVLLLGDEAVYATGDIVRSRTEAPRGFTAESQRARAALAGAAARGGFPDGMALHVGWTPIDLAAVERGAASGPLILQDGVAQVRWSAAAGPMPLEAYLSERVGLLQDPPAGAS